MQRVRNQKGQAIVESTIIMNIILLIFFVMILFSTYVYDRMIVLYAANLAIDEAIGKIPEPGMSKSKIERLMRDSAYGALGLGIFLEQVYVEPNVSKTNGKISVKVNARYAVHIPMVSNFLNNNIISYYFETDYYWK